MNQVSGEPSKLYEERNRRLLDQVALKETDRIPFIFGTRFWIAKFAGITFEEQMYDAEKAAAASKRRCCGSSPTATRRRSTRSGRRWTPLTIGFSGGPGTAPMRTLPSSIWTGS